MREIGHARLAVRLTAFLNIRPAAEEGEKEKPGAGEQKKGVTAWGAVCVVLRTL